MKICIVWQGYDPREVRIAKFVDAITAAGGNVTVLHRGRPELLPGEPVSREAFAVRGTRLTTLPVPLNPLWAKALRRVLLGGRYDLVVVRDIPLFASAWAVAPAHLPLVIDMAEHYPEAMRSWGKYSENAISRLLVHKLRLPDRVEAFSVHRATAISVVCEEQRQRLVSEYGYSSERIAVVMNTPSPKMLASASRNWVPATDSEIVFGYHGILCEDRQLETVVQGFDLAARSDSRLRLLVCGDGESAVMLRRLAESLPSAKRIEFTGRYRSDEQTALYARAHFGLVSLRDTPFTRHTVGNKFFDYPAQGIPFLYPSLPVLKSIAERIGSGIPFEAGNAASVADAMLAATRVDYPSLSARGIATVRAEFTWERDSERLLTMLSRAVAQR